MTDQLLQQILAELKTLNAALAAKQPQARPAQAAQPAGDGQPREIPQPTTLMDDPGLTMIHFGKNMGKTLLELGDRSLEFYASVKDPRLDSAGKPYPPRPQDVKLENAARQLYHSKLGTLKTTGGAQGDAQTTRVMNTPVAAKPAAAENLDEDVPF